jgi:hypothetical protein
VPIADIQNTKRDAESLADLCALALAMGEATHVELRPRTDTPHDHKKPCTVSFYFASESEGKQFIELLKKATSK